MLHLGIFSSVKLIKRLLARTLDVKKATVTSLFHPQCFFCAIEWLKMLSFISKGDDRLEVRAREFSVKNSRNEILFSANRREVLVGADILRVSGKLLSQPTILIAKL